jgi:hypothetical protein
MYIHPELGWRLAEAKIEEARARTQRARALRVRSMDRRTPGVIPGTRRDRRAAPTLAKGGTWRARRRSLRAGATPTTNGWPPVR